MQSRRWEYGTVFFFGPVCIAHTGTPVSNPNRVSCDLTCDLACDALMCLCLTRFVLCVVCMVVGMCVHACVRIRK